MTVLLNRAEAPDAEVLACIVSETHSRTLFLICLARPLQARPIKMSEITNNIGRRTPRRVKLTMFRFPLQEQWTPIWISMSLPMNSIRLNLQYETHARQPRSLRSPTGAHSLAS